MKERGGGLREGARRGPRGGGLGQEGMAEGGMQMNSFQKKSKQSIKQRGLAKKNYNLLVKKQK